ncbi:MAG: HAD family hydrolase [Bacillus sp. (in: firmicutes)]
MLLFTSDLDRTLIYSSNMMKNFPITGEGIPVEYKDDQIITFMSRQSIDLLRQINEKHIFVPVTTRALYQYERIKLFQQEIKPAYAIVCNGGTILHNGQVDQEWNKMIRGKITATCVPKEDMLKVFNRIRHTSWVSREFYVDDFFYVFHTIKEHVPHAELEAFELELASIGWRSFLHGKKLYILPAHLEKAAAVARLQEQLEYDFHVAAGDSLMDYDMISGADIGYSPLHGELYEKQAAAIDVSWIHQNGAASTEEMLQKILGLQIPHAVK